MDTKQDTMLDKESKNEVKNVATSSTPVLDRTPRSNSFSPRRNGGAPNSGGQGGGRPSRFKTAEKPEFDQKMFSIRRVTRVMKGGRRFSFSVSLVIGDRNGRVGVGIGKANDTSFAIQKATNDAKKNLVRIKLNNEHSIAHEVEAKCSSARVVMRPNRGRGVVAGSAIRIVLELAGIKDVTGKVHSPSKNQLNIARATIKALEPFVMARGVEANRDPRKLKTLTEDDGEAVTDELAPEIVATPAKKVTARTTAK